MSLKVRGFKAVLKNLIRASDRYINATEAAAYQMGLWVSNESVKICPKRDGFLRGSRYVTLPESRLKPVVEVGYGGSASEYAIAVHEMPEDSAWTAPGTGPKFLQIPVQVVQKDYAKRLKAYIERNFEREVELNRGTSTPEKPEEGRKE